MDIYRRSRPYLISTISIILFFSCNKKQPEIIRSYYYWRSDSYVNTSERNFLADHQIHKLYARLLDIDWSEVYGAIPVSEVNLNALNKQLNFYDSLHISIIPVIFLTNKTFDKIDTAEIPVLAKRIVRRCLPAYDSVDIEYENRGNYYYNKLLAINSGEIQFDCDWTISTSKKYFQLLDAVKKLLPDSIEVSATIRLHQYKYPSKTGVPPVNRGMLMVYNVSDPKKYTQINSIFNYSDAAPYFTSNKKYPLPLDIVLPAYSWCFIFRNQKFYQIENELSAADLENLKFLRKEENGFYKVLQDTVFQDLFLRPGDEIKAEGISEEILQEAASLAKKSVNSNHYSIALFELSEKEIKNYSRETIDKIYNSYR